MPEDLGVAQLLGGRYRLDRALARGGMAEVSAATDLSNGRQLALKRLRPEVAHDARVVTLFRLEFHTLRGISHPNIIQVYEYGAHEERPFYTMELLSGADLSRIAPVPPSEACSYLRDVATSLSLLQHRRLLHRDVSPRNVRVGADGRCKLLDFGAMAHFGPAPDLVGTPPLVAPECLRGGSLDHRTDLFALGGVAYFLLTGRHAYDARGLDELPARWTKPVPPPSAHDAAIPAELDELVLSLLALDRNTRPASAALVIDRLTAIGGLPPEPSLQVAQSFLDSAQLAGRQREIDKLRARLAEALCGRGSALMVEGNPGVGKTRLLHELATDAQLAGALVVESNARAAIGTHATVTELCMSLLRGAPVETRRAFAPYLPTLGHILPQLEGAAQDLVELPADVIARWAAIQHALVRAFSLLLRERTLVLLIDDLDHADDVSLSFLRGLAQNAASEHLLLVCTQTLASRLSMNAALASFNRTAKHLRLHRLRRAGTAELVKSIFGEVTNADRLAAFLHEVTQGNPTQALQVLRHMMDSGQIGYVGGTWSLPATLLRDDVPQSLVDVLRRQLGKLSAHARLLVDLMALHEGALPLTTWAAASRLAEDELFSGVQELVAAGIVSVSGDAHRLSQDAFRSATQSELSEARARELHLALAQALGASANPPNDVDVRIGHHLILAGHELEGAKKLYAASARISFEGLNLTAAARATEAALAVYERHGRPLSESLLLRIKLVLWSPFTDPGFVERYADRTLQELYEGTGLALAARLQRYVGKTPGLVLGLLVGSLANLFRPASRRCIPLMPGIIGFLRALTPAFAVRAIRLDSPGVHALARYVPVLAGFDRKSSAHGIYLYCEAQTLHFRGEVERSKQVFREFLELFQRPGHMRESKRDENAELEFAGRVALAEATMRHADPIVLDLIRDMGEASPLARVTKAQMRAMYHMVRGEWAPTVASLREFEASSTDLGDVWQLEQIMVPFRGLVAVVLGDVVELKRVIDRLRELSKNAPSLARVQRVLFYSYATFHGRVSDLLSEIEQTFLQTPARSDMIWLDVHLAFANALLSVGAAQRAANVCAAAYGEARGRTPAGDAVLAAMHWTWAQAELASGRPREALAVLDRLIREIEPMQSPLLSGRSHGERALVHLALGDEPAYERDLASLKRYFALSGHPLLLAQAKRFARAPSGAALRSSDRPAPEPELEATAIVAPSSRRSRSPRG